MKFPCLALILWISFLAITVKGDDELELDGREEKEELVSANEDQVNEEIELDDKEQESTSQQGPDENLDANNEDAKFEKDAKPWIRRRRRRWFGRRRRRWFGRRRRRIFRRLIRRVSRTLKRLLDGFIPSCRTSRYRRGNAPATRNGALHSCIYSNNSRCWAPKIYLGIGERYNPSSVEFFLKNMRLVQGSRIIDHNPTIYTLKKGCSNCHLYPKARLRRTTSVLDFFKGQNPKDAPIYAMWREFKQGSNTVRDFIYWAFYPYNLGKKVCIGGVVKKRCIGRCIWLGNHVGDWEHVTVRLVNNRPSKMYIGAHDFGGIYSWNGRTFVKDGDGVKFSSDGHPIVYSAYGSHGKWIYRNRLTYKRIKNGEKLQDLTSSGTAWNTWTKMVLIRWHDDYKYTGCEYWMNYRGRWGTKAYGCKLKKITQTCQLEDGPTGPSGKSVMTKTALN